MSRSDRFATLLALLCALGFVHAIYDPREATTKPPYRREPVLPWYLSTQDDQNSTEDQSRSPKWQVDPDNPVPKKPYVVNADTKTWSPWRKTSESGIEHRTEIATDPQPPIDFNQDRDYRYNSRDLEQRQDGDPARHKGNSENVKSNRDFYDGISPDNTKPRKEELSLSSNSKSTVARYDPRQGVQCPEADSTGQFIYPPDCKFFVNCWKGRAFVQPCAPGTLFSPDSLECDFPHKVSCYGGEVADFPSTEHLESFGREPLLSSSHSFLEHERLQEPRCPPHVTGLLPHPSDCKKFLQCANGGTIIMDCGPGTVFNPAVSVCDWPHSVRGCEDSFKTKEDATTPLVPPEYGTYGHEKLKYNEHQPVKKIACPPDHTGLLPHPDTCKKFLQCTRGGTFIMDCGPGTAFNPLTSVCDWPYNVPSCSKEKATTARPWSSMGSSDSGKWEHGRQYNWTSTATTSRPGTDWEALRPTWRPSWMPNTWSTAKPPETAQPIPPGQHSHGGHYNPNPDAPPRWDHAESSGSPPGQWQHSGNHDETYHHHQHQYHNHRHYPHASVYDSNRRTESQQPSPPYDSSQPQPPNQPTSDSNWHSNSGHHHRQHYVPTQEPSYFNPSESWHPGHHDHPHGRPHSAPHYPEYDDSDQQTQQRPFDPTEDPSNTRVPTQPGQSSWHSTSRHHDRPHGRPHSAPRYPEYDDSDQQTQQRPFDPAEDSSNTRVPTQPEYDDSDQQTQQRPFDQTEDSSTSHVRFDEGNLSPNRGIEHVFSSNRREYSRSGSELPRPSGENVYVDSTHELPEDSRLKPMRNRTSWTLPVPSSRSHQGPSSQPQNRQWDQDRFRESGPRIDTYQSTADKEAESKLNQWSSNTNIFHRATGKYPPGVKDASFYPSRPAPPSNTQVNVNGTRYHFITNGIQVHQGHSNTKTYGPNDRRSSNQFDRNDQNIYIDSQSTIPVPSMDLQPPYQNPGDRSTGVKNVSSFEHGRRTPKYHRMSSQSSDDLAGSDTRYHRVIVSDTNVEQPSYPPPSRSLVPPTNGATNLSEEGNYYIPSDLQPPYFDPSPANSNYPAEPATDLQPPFPEPSQPDRFLVPPSPDESNNSSQRPNNTMGNHDGNDRSDVVKTTNRRVPDMHLVVPRKKKVQRTLEKPPMTVITTTESNIPSVEIGTDENVSTTESSDAVETNVDYIDVLDEKKVWKPVLVFQNRTPATTESTNIMKINQEKADVDLFNIEEPPFEEEEPPFPSYYVPPVEPLDHSRKVAHPTPISGQVIRLRGGSGPHDGYVEVQGKIPGWGIVCDSSWTLKEADIVCKQLGYTRGAEMAWKGRDNRNGVPKWVAANSVTCQGNETRFQLCKFTHESECRVERDAVGVKCVLNRIAHCRKGEIPYEGHCYHLADPDSGFNHAEALDYCSKRQSRLIDITSQAENDFVSEWLLQKHPEVGSVMTSGVGFTTMSHTFWLWEDSSHAKFKYSKWWPGWMEDKKDPPTVGSRPLCIVMKRKFPCHERPDSLCVADYFFWDSEDCATSTKGHSYICKRSYDDIGCVYGKGGQYAGNANVTGTGRPCLPWSDEKVAHSLSILTLNRDVKEKLKTHNYCRNPQPLKDSSPWCFTGRGQREYCDIPPCGNIVTQKSRLSGQCKPRHFECLPGECIPSPWVCDGEEDCTNGADERACTSQMDLFQKHAKHKLEGHDVEKWLNTPLKTCALRCKEADFTCRSFSHKAAGNICLLSDSNIGMTGSLKPNREFDYYEMRDRSIDCDGMFVCGNRKCIDQMQVCNGKNDCNDRSDEIICTVENLDYAIRLAGSDNAYEGRVEVKILGVWGQVCDDGFGMNDADVICKELGFDLGALEVRPGGFYGNLDPPTRFMVDQLQCRGNETSLRECDFEGWGVHNCQPEEAVGVVCKTAVDACQDDYWKCDNSPECILNAYICDEVKDCPDGSDESAEHCDAPFEIRLANGSTPLEGRVEVRHHGIWGTVCDDDFSNAAATVICRSLGYGGKAMVKKNGFFGPGEGPIWLDEVSCRGNETQLYRCDHNNWGRHNCDHDEDAGVICTRGDAHDSKSNWSPVLEKNIEDILPANCGRRFKDFNDDEDLIFGKVVHGNIAPEGSYPWQASLRVRGHSRSSHWCGAVVLSPMHVITAAHCLEGYNKGTYFVRAGDYNTERDEGTELEANIEDYYIHEDFRKGHRMNNDIALVLLKGRGIPLGKDVMPICLPPENIEYPSGLNCTISGFGSIKTGISTHSNDLRYGWVPLLDQSVCRAGHVYGEAAISDGMFCAGYLDEGVDTCDGDSGGPLACYHNGAFTLYGITSWGQHCGKVNKPGVYVRVSYYRRWIDQKIKESLSGR
ncbi:uncharacterized protein LOC143213077 isoform X2 [Lasioglossum baleicum]|uniref:uncharacterized protein LOC143213077 isoform X2 n=1 Tax=Lasioglossum baleicum TaxID=434251 RepID=UPI003FCC5104